MSEGRYLLINEKSFEYLGGDVDGKGSARIQFSRMVERALANDPQFFVTGSKGVMYRAPFNLSVPDVPAGCQPPRFGPVNPLMCRWLM